MATEIAAVVPLPTPPFAGFARRAAWSVRRGRGRPDTSDSLACYRFDGGPDSLACYRFDGGPDSLACYRFDGAANRRAIARSARCSRRAPAAMTLVSWAALPPSK